MSGDFRRSCERDYTSCGRNNSRGANPDRRTTQNHSRVLKTLPRPAIYVGQYAASSFLFGSVFLGESKNKTHRNNKPCDMRDAMTKQQSCNRHNTTKRGRDNWGSRAIHGLLYFILGGAWPRRVPLESDEVRFCPRPQFSSSQ